MFGSKFKAIPLLRRVAIGPELTGFWVFWKPLQHVLTTATAVATGRVRRCNVGSRENLIYEQSQAIHENMITNKFMASRQVSYKGILSDGCGGPDKQKL